MDNNARAAELFSTGYPPRKRTGLRRSAEREHGLAAYMGAPLTHPEGSPCGTLCVLGREPRNFEGPPRRLLLQFRSLPRDYVQAIDGVKIGPKEGSCGSAMYWDKPVIVADIDTDPLWDKYRGLALGHGLRACWSTPITSPEGKVLGAFANYYRETRSPSMEETRLMELAVYIAAIAIERKRAEAKL